VRTDRGVKQDLKGRMTPRPWHCAIRYTLGKGVKQPFFHPYRDVGATRVMDRLDVWYVLEDGTNLTMCLDDVIEQLQVQGDAWFAWAHDPTALLSHYEEASTAFFRRSPTSRDPLAPREPTYVDGVEVYDDYVGRHEVGNPYLIGGWIAIEVGDFDFARQCLIRLKDEFPILESERLILESRLPG